MYKNFFKRLFDFCISLVALICISPILLVVTIWLHFANKGAGAFFLQERPGKNAKIFKVIKFKTMSDERDENGKLLPDEQRITRVGRFVRSTSIDELPQLINVFKGDMALIGLVHYYHNIYRYIHLSKHDATRYDQVLVVGHNVMGATPSAGRRSSNWMCGMWIMCR